MAITAGLDIKGRTGRPYVGSDSEAVVCYIVYTDDPEQDEADIMAAGVLPKRGDRLRSNVYLAAESCSLKREDQCPTMWRATITFKQDSIDPKEQEKRDIPDPIDRPAEIEWDSIEYTVPADRSVEDYIPPGETQPVKAGSPVVNSASDQFDPPAEKTDYRWVAMVTKNVRVVPLWLLDYAGRVNNSMYTLDGILIAEGASRLTGVRIGPRQKEGDFPFRTIRFNIEFRDLREPRFKGEEIPLPWILELQDKGYNKNPWTTTSTYFEGGPSKSSILGADGKPVSMPQFLDGKGSPLASLTPATAKHRCYKIYRTADFNQLPFLQGA